MKTRRYQFAGGRIHPFVYGFMKVFDIFGAMPTALELMEPEASGLSADRDMIRQDMRTGFRKALKP